jgi:hypothetical protein
MNTDLSTTPPTTFQTEIGPDGTLLPEFGATFGEPFSRTLDLSTWHAGEGLLGEQVQLEAEIAQAARQEHELVAWVRRNWYPMIGTSAGEPACAGVFRISPESLHEIHCGLLFNGSVEACGSMSVVHDTLPLNITQIGVCLVTYNGRQNSWAHRLFRRDLRARSHDTMSDVESMLRRRQQAATGDAGEAALSELARRGITAYASHAVLKDHSRATWRMGEGSPAPFELLSGLWTSSVENLRRGLDLINWYVTYGRFVFVMRRTRHRHLLMLGQALKAGEYVIVQTLEDDVRRLIDRGHYRDESGVRPAMEEFYKETARRIVLGLFRVWDGAPPYLFYAQAEHAHVAAHIAMADAMVQQTRGFPMLLDLASTVCRATFGIDSLIPTVETAYAMAGDALRWVDLRGGPA